MPNGEERSVLVDKQFYYDVRDTVDQLDDHIDNLMNTADNTDENVASLDLLEQAAGLLRELVWKYEDSLVVHEEADEKEE